MVATTSTTRTLTGCVSGFCADLGCATDQECRILNGGVTTTGSNINWVCQVAPPAN
jgi:hypothetical protein